MPVFTSIGAFVRASAVLRHGLQGRIVQECAVLYRRAASYQVSKIATFSLPRLLVDLPGLFKDFHEREQRDTSETCCGVEKVAHLRNCRRMILRTKAPAFR